MRRQLVGKTARSQLEEHCRGFDGKQWGGMKGGEVGGYGEDLGTGVGNGEGEDEAR